jgi:hypothetical protein
MQEVMDGYFRSEEVGRKCIEQIADYLAKVSVAGVARYSRPFPVERVCYAVQIAATILLKKKAIVQRQKDAITALFRSNFEAFYAKWSLISVRRGVKLVAARLAKVRLPHSPSFHTHSI